jgi:hypothetical protein
MVTTVAARRLALSFAEVTEQDHHGVPSFRVGNKIFATVPDDTHLRVMLDAHATQLAIADDPAACAELWWGKKLSGVTVTLARADPKRLGELLEEAWRRVAPRRLLETSDEGIPALGRDAAAPRGPRRPRTKRRA